MQIERRTIPGERTETVVGEVDALIERVMARDPSFETESRVLLAREPFEVPREAAIVRAVAGAVESVVGHPPAFVGQTPWMDAALLSAAGTETVVFGAAGAGAHAKEEWADLESVHRLAACLVEAALRYCGAKEP